VREHSLPSKQRDYESRDGVRVLITHRVADTAWQWQREELANLSAGCNRKTLSQDSVQIDRFVMT
jgi:hypothetical protein